MESDEVILKRLREEIDEFVAKYSFNQPELNRIRLRQVPWQAIDILVNTENISSLRSNKNLQRLIRDVRQIGASRKFIDEALNLAIKIYQKMKVEYPALYRRYKARF